MKDTSGRTRNQEPGLKAPVWTWEIPIYFFIGGAAGVAAAIALVASVAGADPSTIRAARWVAAAGAAVSPLLLISDLGRPWRFLYMLRVFKPRSPMSLGAWTLVVFSGAAFGALAASSIGPGGWPLLVLDAAAGVSGLVLATYTGVLLSATVIPVWARHHRVLPFEFGMSSLGAAVAFVEFAGGFTPALNRAGLAAALGETVLFLMQRTTGPAAVNQQIRMATMLGGPVGAGLRLISLLMPAIRPLAAICAIAGSALSRFGWIAAGRSAAGHVSETVDAGSADRHQQFGDDPTPGRHGRVDSPD